MRYVIGSLIKTFAITIDIVCARRLPTKIMLKNLRIQDLNTRDLTLW